MSTYKIFDDERMNKLIDSIQELLISLDMSNDEVLASSLFLAVKASDAMQLSKRLLLMNVSNYWDGNSELLIPEGEQLQ